MDENNMPAEKQDLNQGIFSIFTSNILGTDSSSTTEDKEDGGASTTEADAKSEPAEDEADIKPDALDSEINAEPTIGVTGDTSHGGKPAAISNETEIRTESTGQKLDGNVMFIDRQPSNDPSATDVCLESPVAYKHSSTGGFKSNPTPESSSLGRIPTGDSDSDTVVERGDALIRQSATDTDETRSADQQEISGPSASGASKKDHVCVWCKAKVASANLLLQHWMQIHAPGVRAEFKILDDWNPSEGQKMVRGWKCDSCCNTFRDERTMSYHIQKNPGHQSSIGSVKALGKKMFALLKKEVMEQMKRAEKVKLADKLKSNAGQAVSKASTNNQPSKQAVNKATNESDVIRRPHVYAGKLEIKAVNFVAKFIKRKGGPVPIGALADGLHKMPKALKSAVTIAGTWKNFLIRHRDTFVVSNGFVSLSAPVPHNIHKDNSSDVNICGMKDNSHQMTQQASQLGYGETAMTFNKAGLRADPYAQQLYRNPNEPASSVALEAMSPETGMNEKANQPVHNSGMDADMKGTCEEKEDNDNNVDVDDFVDLEGDDGDLPVDAAAAEGPSTSSIPNGMTEEEYKKWPWVCIECDARFAVKSTWSAHMKTSHKAKPDEKQPAVDSTSDVVRVKRSEQFTVQLSQTPHTDLAAPASDDPYRTYRCTACQKNCDSYANLFNHVLTAGRESLAHRILSVEKFRILPPVSRTISHPMHGPASRKMRNKDFHCMKCYTMIFGYKNMRAHRCAPNSEGAEARKRNVEAKFKVQRKLYAKKSVKPNKTSAKPQGKNATPGVGKAQAEGPSQESILDFSPIQEGEDVISRERDKLEKKQQQADADYVKECLQVNQLKQENRELEHRIIKIKEECVGVHVSAMVHEKVKMMEAEVMLLLTARANLDTEMNRLRDESLRRRQDLSRFYREAMESMQIRLSHMERENERRDVWSRPDDRSNVYSDGDRQDNTLGIPRQGSLSDSSLGNLTASLQPNLVPSMLDSSNTLMDPRLDPGWRGGASNFDPQALSQMVNTMVHQAMSGFGGFPK